MRRTLLLACLAVAPFLPAAAAPPSGRGHRGIVFEALGGGTSDKVLGEGTHFIPLWNSVITYDTRVHEMKEQLNVLSSNGLTLKSTRASASGRTWRSCSSSRRRSARTTIRSSSRRSSAPRRARSSAATSRRRSTRRKREEIERQIYDEVTKALQASSWRLLVQRCECPSLAQPRSALPEDRFTLDKERQEAQRKQIEGEGIAKYQAIVRQGLTREYLAVQGASRRRRSSRRATEYP